MIKDLFKNYIKKNAVAIFVAIVAAIIIIKFALPLLVPFGICIFAWYFIKNKAKNENSGEKSEDVQIKKD